MAKRTTAKAVPAFASERAERDCWDTHDTGDVVDWTAALLADLKVLANKRDVPYQSLLKVYLAERVTSETTANARSNKPLQPTSRARRRAARG